jgi:hypothetical protein
MVAVKRRRPSARLCPANASHERITACRSAPHRVPDLSHEPPQQPDQRGGRARAHRRDRRSDGQGRRRARGRRWRSNAGRASGVALSARTCPPARRSRARCPRAPARSPRVLRGTRRRARRRGRAAGRSSGADRVRAAGRARSSRPPRGRCAPRREPIRLPPAARRSSTAVVTTYPRGWACLPTSALPRRLRGGGAPQERQGTPKPPPALAARGHGWPHGNPLSRPLIQRGQAETAPGINALRQSAQAAASAATQVPGFALAEGLAQRLESRGPPRRRRHRLLQRRRAPRAGRPWAKLVGPLVDTNHVPADDSSPSTAGTSPRRPRSPSGGGPQPPPPSPPPPTTCPLGGLTRTGWVGWGVCPLGELTRLGWVA